MAVSQLQRERVFEHANGYCEYCRTHLNYSSSPFCVEHLLPVSAGGGDEIENLGCACFGCNGHKYSKTSAFDPETGQKVPFFNPRADVWMDHFTWSADFLTLIGLSQIGRATIDGLRLNRPALLKIRRASLLTSEHPAPPTSN